MADEMLLMLWAQRTPGRHVALGIREEPFMLLDHFLQTTRGPLEFGT